MTLDNLPIRKHNRLKNYNYNTNGAYFVTLCTKDKRKILWNSVGETCGRPLEASPLSKIGLMVEDEINRIQKIHPTVVIDKYVIMPNHIHLIVLLQCNENGRPQVAPTISRIIQQFKGAIVKKAEHPLWQRSFHDHIIRNEQDYKEIWNYIENNPSTWNNDCFNDLE